MCAFRLILPSNLRMRWVRYVARMSNEGCYKILIAKQKGRDRLGDSGEDRRIILKWMLWKRRQDAVDWIGLRIGSSGGFLTL
jgi:hypothetical protein